MQRKLTRLLLAAVMGLGLTIPQPADGQETSTVQGIVRDSLTGESLPFATITVIDGDRQVIANRDGFFALVGAPTDGLTLRITFLGYRPRQLTLEPGQSPDLLTVEMLPIPVEIEGLTIVGDEYRFMKTTGGVSKITASPKDMAMLPNVGEVDIFRSLQLLPGISGTNESSSGLYVRGGTPDQNLVLLDGITVYHVDHFFGFFSAFNAEAIKDVAVYKSAFPAQYGGRVSSVVDMTGKAGDPKRAHLSLGANLLSSQIGAQLPLFGRGAILFTARRSYTDLVRTGLYSSIFDMFNGTDSVITAPQPRGGRGRQPPQFANANFATTQPDFYFYDLNAKITFRPSTRDVLAISAYNGQDDLDKSRVQNQTLTTQSQQFSRAITSDIIDLTNWGNKGISGKWAKQWHPRFYSDALIAYSEYFSDFNRTTSIEVRDPNLDSVVTTRNFGSAEDNQVRDLTFRLDNEWQLGQTHKLSFGAWGTNAHADYRFIRNDSVTILDQQQDAFRMAGYVQTTWTGWRPLRLTVGTRLVYHDRTARTYIEPRISALLALSPDITVKGAYGRHHQFVSRVVNENVTEGSRDFWLLADNDLVDVTGSRHFVVGATYETDVFLFDAELYRKDLTGLSEFSLRFQRARDPDPLNLFFDGTGVAQGVEVLAQRKFGAFTGWASYTLSRIEHTFPDLNNGEPFPALHDQTHEFKAVGSFSTGRWTISGTWMFATGKPYTAPESEYTLTLLDGTQQSFIHVGGKNALRLPDYHRLDLAVHYRFDLGIWSGDVALSAFNFYNRTNVWYREFDLSETPMVVTDVNYLGATPNLSVRFGF